MDIFLSNDTTSDAFWAEEGLKVLKELNLSLEEVESGKKSYGRHYLDPVWRHPQTGGKIYVGDSQAASVKGTLLKHDIFHVVNCTTDLPNYHQKDARFSYCRFPISNWKRVWERDVAEFVAFLVPMLAYVHRCLEKGQSVLVHCLAGAHRAGTTGVVLVMFFGRKKFDDALKCATMVRPVIHPFAHLKTFGLVLEKNEEAVRLSFEEEVGKGEIVEGGGTQEEKDE